MVVIFFFGFCNLPSDAACCPRLNLWETLPLPLGKQEQGFPWAGVA
jgi:hypothetical protein